MTAKQHRYPDVVLIGRNKEYRSTACYRSVHTHLKECEVYCAEDHTVKCRT